MEKIQTFPHDTCLFVFDLEFVGDVRNLETCQIWEIAVYCVHTQAWFDYVVDPNPDTLVFPPPPIPEIPQLTRDFLSTSQAKTWDIVFAELSNWISQQSHGSVPVFISHNTFRADKPIMEQECRRYNTILPLHWYFFDSLHYSRRMLKNNNGNYSLSGLHEHIFSEEIAQAHRARSDVTACTRIIHYISNGSWQLVGPIYPSHTTSLRSVRWIGQKAEEVLFDSNIRSVEQLMSHIHNLARQDFIFHQLDYKNSVIKTLLMVVGVKLPKENVKNIATVLSHR
jgi:hypothetical protein